MLMRIAKEAFDIQTLEAKISFDNHSSIHIFTTKFGFVEVSRSEVFREITFERHVDEEFSARLRQYECEKYSFEI